MEAAARTATRFPVDREQHAMTRHGRVPPSAAGTQPLPAVPLRILAQPGLQRRRRSRCQTSLIPSVKRVPRGTLGPGEVFGEMCLIEPGPRSASVKAVTDVECIATSYDDFVLRRPARHS